MRHRLIDSILLILLVWGLWLAWGTGQKRARLQATHDRILHRIRGRGIEAEPSRSRVVPLETGEPLHYQWLIQIPPGDRVEVTDQGGFWSSAHTITGLRETHAGFRLFERSDGNLWLEYRHRSGANGRVIGGRAVADLLRGRLDRLRVEGLIAGDPVTLDDPDQPLVLIRLTLPEDLRAESQATLRPNIYDQIVPIFFEMTIRPISTESSP